MDHIRVLQTEVSFSAYCFHKTLLLPTYDSELIQDIRLRFWGEAGIVERSAGVYPEDVRLYLDHIDVTPQVLAIIRRDLSQRETARPEYLQGLQRQVQHARQMGKAYGNPNLAEEEAIVERLSRIGDFSQLLGKLGERQGYGWGGAFHPFNLLYRDVRIPPISVKEVIEAYNDANGASLDPLTLYALTISSGPLGNPDHKLGWAGRAAIAAEIQFHNTLRDRVEAIETELTDLKERILAELEVINDALGPNGDLQSAIADLEREVQSAKDSLGLSATELNSHTAQLGGIQESLKQIKEAIRRL